MMKIVLELLLGSQLTNDGIALQKPHIKESQIPQMESPEARVTILISEEHLEQPLQMLEHRK